MKAYVLLLLMVFPGIALNRQIVINEVMASNHITLLDEDGEAAGWIER